MNIPLPSQTDLQILSSVVYKELCEDRRQGIERTVEKEDGTMMDFWELHHKETLDLARNIIKVKQSIENIRPNK